MFLLLKTSYKNIMQIELLTRMQYEPSIIMFGMNYKKIPYDVLAYSWNAVITTSCELELSAALITDKRSVHDVFSIENMQDNLLDKNKLHVIHLFGENYPKEILDEIEKEDMCDFAIDMLSRMAEVIKRNGLILIDDFEENCFSHKELRKALRHLYPNQNQVHIFNCKDKGEYLSLLEKEGKAVLYEESIQDFFEKYVIKDNFNDDYQTDYNVSLYVGIEKHGMPTMLEKKSLLETESFATLLNIELLNEVKIPQYMYKDYFYLFLKNSVREPQWYGYNYGFNIHREYEDQLYKKVKEGLEKTGNPKNKLLMIVGQTGTGKSIALAAIAHKIFNDKKYPVVYINNPDVYFYSRTEYKQRDITKKSSPEFNALDSLIERLEDLGAKAVLILWDTSSFSAGRGKVLSLYRALLSRGRKIYLVSTAYELNNISQGNAEDDFNEESRFDNEFVECKAMIGVSNEIKQLKEIMFNKCRIPQSEVDKIMTCFAKNNDNFLSLFYQAFEIIRSNLSQGVFKEASHNIQELDVVFEDGIEGKTIATNIFALALKKVENELISAGIFKEISLDNENTQSKNLVSKDLFVKCIAVCSKFKLKMPYDFALRILGTYNEKIVRILTKSTFFVISQDIYGNYEISMRTPLEAMMYLEAKGLTPIEEIDCVIQMLNHMNPYGYYGQQKEVRLCEKLIRIMGPNSSTNRYTYKNGYEEIIKALLKLRTQNEIWEPILISQEITYIRECIGSDENRPTSERIEALKDAIDIADKVLARYEYYGISMGTRNAIKVESANSKLLLCNLNNSNNSTLYKEIRRDLREVIKYDSLDYHAYVTLLKGSISEYNNERDNIKKIELIESMCSLADEIILNNPDVAGNEFFRRKVTEIYILTKNTPIAQNYIDELVANGSAAGLYVQARQQLMASGVDFKKGLLSNHQEEACQSVYALYNNAKYRNVMKESESCQYMLLNIVWLLNNKKPIYSVGECWLTHISEEGWLNILNITNDYLLRFCRGTGDVYQSRNNIKYLKALCLAQLKSYSKSLTILNSIEEDSSIGIERVFTKHMLCEEDGTTRKFTGRLGKYDEVRRTGVVYIDEFGNIPIYYHGPHMKTSNLIEGTIFNDIEIGYSNIAPKAYREVGIAIK